MDGSGGGGGSSFTVGGATNVTHQQGVRTGDGQVVITYTIAAIPTLSEWAQLGMMALLVLGGLLALRRRSGQALRCRHAYTTALFPSDI
jgi:hypothetical protein